MKRYVYLVLAAFCLALIFSGSAEATKPSHSNLSCANMRCGQGSVCQNLSNGPQCVIQSSPPGYYVPDPNDGSQQHIPPGYYNPTPVHPPVSPPGQSCAVTLCEVGHQCVESFNGPKCMPVNSPPGYHRPNPPNYQDQSCAYGGYYHYGRLICNPAPTWRQPYQDGWQRPPPGYHVPPTYRPHPRHSRPGYGNVPETIPPAPRPGDRMCPMNYDPVCAEKPVVCVKTPCFPVRKTFSNGCAAGVEGYTILYKGVCQ